MSDFVIRFGVPEMSALWLGLVKKEEAKRLDAGDEILFRKLVKTFRLLEKNPRHPGLCTHEIEPLSRRYKRKVWQSYLENRKPAAGRLFWVYGPENLEITIIGLEPHPDSSKAKGYEKVRLSGMAEKLKRESGGIERTRKREGSVDIIRKERGDSWKRKG